jgi:geranylgeranyl pyrophosphate synthase
MIIQLFGRLFRLPFSDVEVLARAAELIHTASLIHDDVVDNALQRRGVPTLNTNVSNSQAVLAGDFLLARVIVELTERKQFENLRYLAQTLEDIVEAEFLQDRLKKEDEATEELLLQVGRKKTGSLLAWCSGACAIAAGADPESVRDCRLFGEKVGIAFQLIDDNLDYSEQSGKDYAKDLKEGLINYPTLQLLRLYPELYYPVYQLRGNDFQEVPWTEGQMKQATQITYSTATNLLLEAEDLLRNVVHRNERLIEPGVVPEFKHLLSLVLKREK